MPGTIEIFDKNKQGSAIVDLPDILGVLEPEGQHFTWSISDLEATGDVSRLGTTIHDLEQAVANAPNGLVMDWKGLNELTGELDQISKAPSLVAGIRTRLPKISFQSDLPLTCDIVIESLDTSMWKVFSRDDGILQKLKSAFRHVKVV